MKKLVNVTWPAQPFLRSYTLSPLRLCGTAAFVTAFKTADAIAVRSATVQHWSRNINTSKSCVSLVTHREIDHFRKHTCGDNIKMDIKEGVCGQPLAQDMTDCSHVEL